MAYNRWRGGTCEGEWRSHASVMLTSQPRGPPMRGKTRGEKEKVAEKEARGADGVRGEENVSGYISF